MSQPHLLIRGACLYSPTTGLSAPQDLRVAGGVVAELGVDLPTGDAEVVDGQGSVLTAGLVAASLILNWIHEQLPPHLGGDAAHPAHLWGVRLLVWTPAVLGFFIIWFFRNPRRRIPQAPGLVVAPADGKVVQIEEIAHDEFIGGPAIQIGIFLSIFNVHINRTPVSARVIGIRYRKGKFLNAMRPESSRENEQLAVRLEEATEPYRRMIVRQITGAIARRIVCWVKPGDELAAGEQFGMIKLGSRTELVVPREPGLHIECRIGQMVQAGTSVLARYESLPPSS